MAIGIVAADTSQDKINFAILKDLEVVSEYVIENKQSSLKRFIKAALEEVLALEGVERVIFVMEYTGIYNNILLRNLVLQGCSAYLCSGLSVKNSSGLIRGKSDKIDAVRIGQYAFRYFDKLVQHEVKSESLQKLSILDTKRSQYKKVLQSLTQAYGDNKRFLEKDQHNLLVSYDKNVVKELRAAIKKIESEMIELVKVDEEVFKNFKIAKSVPGVGKITAIALICATNNFKAFDSAKAIASYCGVVPFCNESGKKKGKARVSYFANKKLKKLLHLGATSLIRSNSHFAEYYRRKLAENKNPMLILNNIRNKMVRAVFACVTRGEMYDANYQHPLQAA